MASYLYNTGLEGLLDGSIDFEADTIRILLVSPSGTFNKAHEFVNEVTANEVTNDTGTGYERKNLSTKSQSLDVTNDRVLYTADDFLYESIDTNETLNAAIIYKFVSSDTNSPVIGYWDFASIITNGSDVELRIPAADGLFAVNNNLA